MPPNAATIARDGRWLKSFLAFVFFANLLNTGFAVADLYLALVSHFVFATDPVIVVSSFATLPAADTDAAQGTVASSVQLFFAWRVHILTGKWYLGVSTGMLAIGQLVCAMLMAWKCREFPAWANFANFTGLIIAWMTTTILVDVTITVILVWYLFCGQFPMRAHKTGFQGTDQLVDRIIRLTVQTGLLTSVWALIDLVLFLTMPNASHLIFQIPMVKMYTNSLMSSLNSRGSNRAPDSFDSIVHTSGKFVNPRGLRKHNSTYHLDPGSHPEVFVHVERHEMGDVSKAQPKNRWVDTASHAV
ncbi:hypothetical protein B0H16DRAFT_1711494 [Mycena metata]|uniref:DUF6534 domain-containing protein n=1 Tax=Mycena metata TaxID=1033252 RepID=A0AAD7K661_9AGAR|nr:hypothetical protein B0H16DRAFT_1711494 [Mycena metata]